MFIDDIIQVSLGSDASIKRSSAIVPLVFHILGRPNSPTDNNNRCDLLELDKLKAEGTPNETQRVLGWIINTHSLSIQLPKDKFITWSKAVKQLSKSKWTTYGTLVSLRGQLNHAALGIPLARYWLRRLTDHIENANDKTRKSTVNSTSNHPKPRPWFRFDIPTALAQDMLVWEKFLQQAYDRISLNLLTLRRPTHVYFADACPTGMGGFSVSTGVAWRCELDTSIFDSMGTSDDTDQSIRESAANHNINTTSNNLFEFIAIVVSIWLDHIADQIPSESAIFALSDNSSAVGWLHRASYGMNRPLHSKVSHKFINIILDSGSTLISQHIPGRLNIVSDLLSRRFDLSDSSLTSLLLEKCKSQVPQNFVIRPLPKEVKLWISSIVPMLPEFSLGKLKVPPKAGTELGADGLTTSIQLDSPMTPSLTPFNPSTTKLLSSVHFSSNTEIVNGLHNIRDLLNQALSRRPLATWHRSSGITPGKAPATLRSAKSTPSLGHSSKPGPMKTLPKKERKQSLGNT